MKKNFSIRLKKVLKNKQINKTTLAKELNLSVSTTTNWISGKNMPNYFHFIALCKFLKIHAKDLLGH